MKIAIIDGNNLAFKTYSVMKDSRGGLLKNSFQVPTTVIFGMLRVLNSLVNKTKTERVIVCWDTTGSYYRRSIFKLYKKHRKYIDMKDYFEELDAARIYMDRFGINQGTCKGIEADDLIGFLAHSYGNKGHKIIVVSDDKDFYQIVNSQVKLYRPIKESFVGRSEVIDQIGVRPKDIPKLKAITGEDSDFIPGICDIDEENMKLIKCGLGEKNAIKILKCGRNLREAIDKCSIPRWSERLKNKKDQILMSYKLARIRTQFEDYPREEQTLIQEVEKDCLKQKEVKVKKVLTLINDLEIRSVNIVNLLRNLGVRVAGKNVFGGKIKT